MYVYVCVILPSTAALIAIHFQESESIYKSDVCSCCDLYPSRGLIAHTWTWYTHICAFVHTGANYDRLVMNNVFRPVCWALAMLVYPLLYARTYMYMRGIYNMQMPRVGEVYYKSAPHRARAYTANWQVRKRAFDMLSRWEVYNSLSHYSLSTTLHNDAAVHVHLTNVVINYKCNSTNIYKFFFISLSFSRNLTKI